MSSRKGYICLVILATCTVFVACLTEESNRFHGHENKRTFKARDAHDRVLQRAKRSTTGDLSEAEIRECLYRHNFYRSQEGSSNMEYMIWNSELARMASDYVRLCEWRHSSQLRRGYNISFGQVGENLHYTNGGRNVTVAMKLWYDEKMYYNYEARNCTTGQMCGHYTQVVWARSREMGCGITLCSALTMDDGTPSVGNATYFACNYGPRGNYLGAPPYKKGEACSECESGERWCKMGLCYHDCEQSDTGCERSTGFVPSTPVHITTLSRSTTLSTTPTPKTSSITPTSTERSTSFTTLSRTPSKTTLGTSTTGVQTPGSTETFDCKRTGCLNGGSGSYDTSKCVCNCTDEYRGQTCQFSRTEDKFGALLTFVGNISLWPVAWSSVRSVIVDSVNQYCGDNAGVCCEPDGKYTGSGIFLTQSELVVGSGYPFQDSTGRFVVMILARRSPDNRFCEYASQPTDVYLSRDVLNDGLFYEKESLTAALSTCCNLTMVTSRPNPEPVTSPASGLASWKLALIVTGTLVVSVTTAGFLLYRFRSKLQLRTRAILVFRDKDTVQYDKTTVTMTLDQKHHSVNGTAVKSSQVVLTYKHEKETDLPKTPKEDSVANDESKT